MNNQARGCELKCKYNVQGICHAYGECIAKDLFIAELEKIRKEIMDKGMIPTHTYITVDGKALQKSVVDVVIDKHIAELKGKK